MRISPITLKYNTSVHSNNAKDFIPTPVRYNQLRDNFEFDMIAEKIRSENLKNQMNVKLTQLKKNISNFINQANA